MARAKLMAREALAAVNLVKRSFSLLHGWTVDSEQAKCPNDGDGCEENASQSSPKINGLPSFRRHDANLQIRHLSSRARNTLHFRRGAFQLLNSASWMKEPSFRGVSPVERFYSIRCRPALGSAS